jgi:hypothetical protein
MVAAFSQQQGLQLSLPVPEEETFSWIADRNSWLSTIGPSWTHTLASAKASVF